MRTRLLLIFSMLFLFIRCNNDDPSAGNDPVDEEVSVSIYEECLTTVSENTLDILTWNVKEFPIAGEATIETISEIIETQDADIIAFQEVTNSNELNALLDKLDGWEGTLDYTGGLNLAYIYKTAEVSSIGEAVPIITDNSYAFPRPPYLITIEHTNGMEATLINLHLKCCSGSENENRREQASDLLKSYIDEKLPDSNVIVLGDFNDLIIEEYPSDNVFSNFIADSLNYKFADMEIAAGPEFRWSYPSWPSHIDHLLITNELFDNVIDTETLSFDDCDENYSKNISDHRPVMLRLSN